MNEAVAPRPLCRGCGADLADTFVDLGVSPLSNSYVRLNRWRDMEPFFPLHAFVCRRCMLVQVECFETPERIFTDYAYLSGYSDSWLEHCEQYAETTVERLGLKGSALVVEVASNDGCLLQYFHQRGITVLGIEPAKNIAAVAARRGVPTESVFLGKRVGQDVASRMGRADLVVANNVIAHVPAVHDFVAGLVELLKPSGTMTLEFPHLLRLIEGVQFDTIYHEHFSYFSLYSLESILVRHDLRIFDVEELPTHGGSLRLWVAHASEARHEESRVEAMRETERAFGLTTLDIYREFPKRVSKRKREILSFLIEAAENGRAVVGYGAPAKGNTLLNYCGIRPDMMAYTVDRNPSKQGTLLPGSRIPVFGPEQYERTRPEYVYILPWNIRDEVVEQNAHIRSWGGKFVVAAPDLEVF